MDEAATCRRAAIEAIQDIYPDRLRDDLEARLESASMAPGVLTIRCARAVDDAVDPTSVAQRAAGVQLIYEGLRLTRSLAHDEPWADSDDHTQPNLDSLAATVLVSRGFYLLARTDAASKAVATVRRFGRDQTSRRAPDADTAGLDVTLERDVFELAATAGVTAVDATPTTELFAQVDDLAVAAGIGLDGAAESLPGPTELQTGATAGDAAGADDHVRQPATDS
ncbi:DUF7114 family protein [Haloarchaeobius amylolyticus]|uniref:DUF7114 family protein n=1 Tax=Haloarchaeobius amylolyticus TaxID=1198296 RepID=UPI0022715037|nr:hypothetical protein [Haloarchaeobius amylolyticus]